MIYAGPLGRNSHKLVQYFEASLPFIICFTFHKFFSPPSWSYIYFVSISISHYLKFSL